MEVLAARAGFKGVSIVSSPVTVWHQVSPGSRAMTIRRMWNETVIAGSGRAVAAEGRRYFPAGEVGQDFPGPGVRHLVGPWQGLGGYFDVAAESARAHEAAWRCPAPSPPAGQIAGRVAFWKRVRVPRVRDDDAGPGRRARFLHRVAP